MLKAPKLKARPHPKEVDLTYNIENINTILSSVPKKRNKLQWDSNILLKINFAVPPSRISLVTNQSQL